jgi:phosphatidylglycerol---prolipoprotein diacylglyceryl transferase
MLPVTFHVGAVEITGFGIMVGVGAYAGAWMFQRELRARALPDAVAVGLAGLVGGMVGAKLLYVLEEAGQQPVLTALFSRGGFSWFGGLLGGIVVASATVVLRRLPWLGVAAAAAPAIALGQAFGRIGCFLVGDDYGRPSGLPWAVAFPQGLPPTTERVHPTQLYEAVFLFILAAALWHWRRGGATDRVVVARYCLLAGGFRFLLEFIRVDPRIVFGLTVAQFVCWTLVAVGLSLALTADPSPRGAPFHQRWRA